MRLPSAIQKLFSALTIASGIISCQTTSAPLTDRCSNETRDPSEFREVVFFASWCPGCKEHIEQRRNATDVLFVATFDEAGRASRVLDAFDVKGPCVIDQGIARAYHIEVLPAVRKGIR